MAKKDDEKPTIHIQSHNQQGGVTAHTVNVGQLPRRLSNPKLLADRLRRFAGTKVVFLHPAGDGEAQQLAAAIQQAVGQAGWLVPEFNSVLAASMPIGVVVRGPGTTIEDFSQPMGELGRALMGQRITCVAEISDTLEIFVGVRPT